MFQPIKTAIIDLDGPLSDLDVPPPYQFLQALVRTHGQPIGTITLSVRDGRVTAGVLAAAVLSQHSQPLMEQLLRCALHAPVPAGGVQLSELRDFTPGPLTSPLPLVTVAVCTRDRTEDLRVCLDALRRLTYPALDLLVVDNAPGTDEIQELVREQYPSVRYVREPRPGLDRARNRAIREAKGEILAFTDDDAVADPEWVTAMVRTFLDDPCVTAVTGLVTPFELDTEAQVLFERYGGFGKGFKRRWYRLAAPPDSRESFHVGAGRFGTGANMAFRRTVFEQVGGFDPALDVGTVTNGGGDLEMFFRVLQEGHTLVYEPAAIVRHRHRRTYPELRAQITGWGTGFVAYLIRCGLHYRELRRSIIRFAVSYLWARYARFLVRRLLAGKSAPLANLRLAEFRGSLSGLFRYRLARRLSSLEADSPGPSLRREPIGRGCPRARQPRRHWSTAVRTIEISEPIREVSDLHGYANLRLIVMWQDRPVGQVELRNVRDRVSVNRLRDAIVEGIGTRLFDLAGAYDTKTRSTMSRARVEEYLRLLWGVERGQSPTELSPSVPVSLVIATYDRPDSLRRCLEQVKAQKTSRPFEVVVVDNHPCSRLTPPVVQAFPGVLLIDEPRRGLSYARNAGIRASSGAVIVTTDDDVTMPPHWLERLLGPLAREEVAAVTGNVLPFELTNRAQILFEAYGGLGRGYEPLEFDSQWFRSFRRRAVPTWRIGATANAAFRAGVFAEPAIGLFDEALGSGTPTGCSEDTYVFYKMLKGGCRMVYEPAAYVWHEHRSEMGSLRRQIYNYSKGHVAYHLTTVLKDRDCRGIRRLLGELPLAHLQRAVARLRGRSPYPLSMLLVELVGNMVGPVALLASRLRVRWIGRSAPTFSAASPSITRMGMPTGHPPKAP